MIAHIWKVKSGWLLELAEGTTQAGHGIIGTASFKSKVSAKQAARLANAKPWNY